MSIEWPDMSRVLMGNKMMDEALQEYDEVNKSVEVVILKEKKRKKCPPKKVRKNYCDEHFWKE